MCTLYLLPQATTHRQILSRMFAFYCGPQIGTCFSIFVWYNVKISSRVNPRPRFILINFAYHYCAHITRTIWFSGKTNAKKNWDSPKFGFVENVDHILDLSKMMNEHGCMSEVNATLSLPPAMPPPPLNSHPFVEFTSVCWGHIEQRMSFLWIKTQRTLPQNTVARPASPSPATTHYI